MADAAVKDDVVDDDKGKPLEGELNGEPKVVVPSGAGGEDNTGIMVPKHRLDSVSGRLKSANLEVEDLKRKLGEVITPIQPSNEPVTMDTMDAKIRELDVRATKAAADGDFESQAKHMTEARNIERNINRLVSENAATVMGTQAVQEMHLTTACESLVREYPVLDPDNDLFDDELSEEILEVYQSFVANKDMKISLGDKMRRAVGLLVKTGPTTNAADKKTTDRAKNLKDAGSIPGNLEKVGADHDKAGNGNKGLNVLTMTEDEFDKLSEDDKVRLRGDLFS